MSEEQKGKSGWLDKLKGQANKKSDKRSPPPIEIPQVQITQSYDGGTAATISLRSAGDAVPPPDTAQLRRQMNQYLTLVDLEEIGAELDVPYASLPEGKDSKVYGLIAAGERQDALAELLAACAKRYPTVPWGRSAVEPESGGERPFLDTIYLRQQMSNHLSENQLAAVCAAVNLDYDTLPGGKGRKVLTIIQASEQQGCLETLLHACETAVPDVDWHGNFKQKSDQSKFGGKNE